MFVPFLPGTGPGCSSGGKDLGNPPHRYQIMKDNPPLFHKLSIQGPGHCQTFRSFSLALLIMFLIVVVLMCVAHLKSVAAGADRQFYTAAVFEHARFGGRNDSASLVVETNLNYYKRAAEIAKSKGADVIVFPEYGIFLPSSKRSELKPFLENIPDPRKSRVNPCEERDAYNQRPILYTLSCIAKNNSLVVVANTGDIQNCEGQDECPSDGVFHFNANVVFDRDGTLLVRYRKEHLFYELGMDLAREQQNSTFRTDFGTFATYICFDIIFERMSRVAQWPDVDGIMFSTMWIDMPPQYSSIQFWQSWALGTNATLLSSNIQIPGYCAVGSGVFHRKEGALAYTYNPDGISKLVVVNVPKSGFPSVPPEASITAISETESWDWNDNGKDVPMECSRKLLNDSIDIYKDFRCFEEKMNNYTFVKLTESSGHVEACDNGMCCSLDYSTSGLTGNYYLGVSNGSHTIAGRYFWCEENCVLARCDAFSDLPCSTFPMKSDTLFKNVHLLANFTTDFVYPSVMESGMKLVPLTDWYQHNYNKHHKSLHFKNSSGKNLLAVGMKGRCYERDPPFKR